MTSRGCNEGMPRTAPAGADAELIDELASHGLVVSLAQLERWRRACYLLPHPRPGRGRGRGRAGQLVPQTVQRAVQLAYLSRRGKAVGVVAWEWWAADGTSRGLALLREQMVAALETFGRRLAVGSGRDEEGWQQRYDAARAAARTVRRGHDQHALIVHSGLFQAAGATVSIPDLPPVDNAELALVAARLLAGGPDDVGAEEFLTAAGQALQDEDGQQEAQAAAAAQAACGGEWEGFPLPAGLASAVEVLRHAPHDQLQAATAAVTAVASIQTTVFCLGLSALQGEAPRIDLPVRVGPDALPTMLADPMWADCGRHLPLDPHGAAMPAALAFQSALTLHLPGRSAAMSEYRARLEHLLHPAT